MDIRQIVAVLNRCLHAMTIENPIIDLMGVNVRHATLIT
ncbi:MAG: hypothetical protein ACJAWS_000956 [Oleiphilaceae bacterium]|jgi:hypothetical protein